MFYLIYAQDVKDSLPKRQAVLGEHLARLTELKNQNRLVNAGAMLADDVATPQESDANGTAIIAQFANLDEAYAWAKADPFYQAGVYEQLTVSPFFMPFSNQ